MAKRTRKIAFILIKLAIAAALLTLVARKVHWRDYVVDQAGQSFAVEAVAPTASQPETTFAPVITLLEGSFWNRHPVQRPLADFQPQGGVVVRPGFARSLKLIHWPLLICGAMGFLIAVLIVAVRWWMLLKMQQIHLTLRETIRLTFLGQFFNIVVPGTVGGDLVKAYYASKHTSRKAVVLVTIFLDRVLGLAELTLIAAVMIAVAWMMKLGNIRLPAMACGVIFVLTATAMALLFSPRLRKLLHLQKLYQRLPIAHHFAAAAGAANLYRRQPLGLLKAVGVTLISHSFWIGGIVLVGESLNLNIGWYVYFLNIPLIYIIGSVPLAPGGVGWVEQLYLTFFAAASPSTVLALALLARVIPIIWALPGVVVAITGPRLPKTQAIQAELGIDAKAE